MNKTCQNCNQINLSQATFCSNCASPLPPSNFGGGGQQQGNQQWNQPNFGGQQQGQQFAPSGNPGGGASQKATAALILAIAGFFCCSIFTTIPAIVVGWMEMNAIKAGQSPREGLQMAQIGFWIGIIVTVLHIGGMGLWFFMVLLAAASDPYSGY